ncbi:hypothetical protein Hanom_Chr05g00440411 [Helianthus anomalus]
MFFKSKGLGHDDEAIEKMLNDMSLIKKFELFLCLVSELNKLRTCDDIVILYQVHWDSVPLSYTCSLMTISVAFSFPVSKSISI